MTEQRFTKGFLVVGNVRGAHPIAKILDICAYGVYPLPYEYAFSRSAWIMVVGQILHRSIFSCNSGDVIHMYMSFIYIICMYYVIDISYNSYALISVHILIP